MNDGSIVHVPGAQISTVLDQKFDGQKIAVPEIPKKFSNILKNRSNTPAELPACFLLDTDEQGRFANVGPSVHVRIAFPNEKLNELVLVLDAHPMESRVS